jgi:hypothetical protein
MSSRDRLIARHFDAVYVPRPETLGRTTRYGIRVLIDALEKLESVGRTFSEADVRLLLAVEPRYLADQAFSWKMYLADPAFSAEGEVSPAMVLLRSLAHHVGAVPEFQNTNLLYGRAGEWLDYDESEVIRMFGTSPSRRLAPVGIITDLDAAYEHVFCDLSMSEDPWTEEQQDSISTILYRQHATPRHSRNVYPKAGGDGVAVELAALPDFSFASWDNLILFSTLATREYKTL